MITEQEYLFETKVELFCEINGFKYANIIKLMLLKHENLVNKIININDEKNINEILSSDELNSIVRYYNQNLREIEERIKLLSLIGDIDRVYLEKEIMKSQDLIRRLIKQPIEIYVECFNKFNADTTDSKKVRLEEAMKFLNKSLNDSIVKKYG